MAKVEEKSSSRGLTGMRVSQTGAIRDLSQGSAAHSRASPGCWATKMESQKHPDSLLVDQK